MIVLATSLHRMQNKSKSINGHQYSIFIVLPSPVAGYQMAVLIVRLGKKTNEIQTIICQYRFRREMRSRKSLKLKKCLRLIVLIILVSFCLPSSLHSKCLYKQFFVWNKMYLLTYLFFCHLQQFNNRPMLLTIRTRFCLDEQLQPIALIVLASRDLYRTMVSCNLRLQIHGLRVQVHSICKNSADF